MEYPDFSTVPMVLVIVETASVLLEDVLLEDVLLEDVLLEDVLLEDVLLEDVLLEEDCSVIPAEYPSS